MEVHVTNPSPLWIAIVAVLAVWELVWKGNALWRASKRNDGVWFVILLVINSAGILPIIYLLMTRNSKSGK